MNGTGDAQLRAAGESVEALQQGTAGQGRRGEGTLDRRISEPAAAGSVEAVPGQHLGQ